MKKGNTEGGLFQEGYEANKTRHRKERKSKRGEEREIRIRKIRRRVEGTRFKEKEMEIDTIKEEGRTNGDKLGSMKTK